MEPAPEALRHAALGRIPHDEQAAMVWVLLKPAQRGDIELKAGGDGDVEPEPGHGDGTKDVAVGECKHAPADGFT